MTVDSNDSALIILKLGGSIITNKDKPHSLNEQALNLVVSAISSANKLSGSNLKLIIVHGGGSFGHYYAKKFHISQQSSKVSPLGIAVTNQSMLELHFSVRQALLRRKLGMESVLPSELLTENLMRLTSAGKTRIRATLDCGLIPVTFGYVMLRRSEAFVISGDQICKAIANSLNVRKLIFVMNVDGIYPNPSLRGEIIHQLSSASGITTSNRAYDVTGGIAAKLRLGLDVLKTGAQVFYVNGHKPNRLRNLLLDKKEEGATELVG
jgi:isopentenyl phosphate kinase